MSGKASSTFQRRCITILWPPIIDGIITAKQPVAWKNGNFLFNDTYLPDIMLQLSRWYDVEVGGENFPRIRYNGGIPRSMQLSEVLKMLEETGNVKFQLVNNKITIKQ